jgi:prefoldin subunit 5
MGIKRPNRNIEVFDISLMAVVTKAMGAFLVIMIMLLPSYYIARSQSEPAVNELRQQVDDLQRRLQEINKNIGKYTGNPEELRRQLVAAIDQLDQAKARIEVLNSRLSEAVTLRDRLDDEVRKLRAQVQNLEREKDSATARMNAQSGELAALRKMTETALAKPVLAVALRAQDRCGSFAGTGDEVRIMTLIAKPEPADAGAQAVARLVQNDVSFRMQSSGTGGRNSQIVASGPNGWQTLPFRSDTDRNEMFVLRTMNDADTHLYIAVHVPRSDRPCDVTSSLTLFQNTVDALAAMLPIAASSAERAVDRLIAVVDRSSARTSDKFLRMPTPEDVAAVQSKFNVRVEPLSATAAPG